MFSVLSAVKFVASGVVGLGTSKIVAGIIKNNVTPETLIDKVSVAAAAWTISAMAAAATKKYTDEAIDDTVKTVKEAVGDMKTKAKLAKINRGESTFGEEDLDPADFTQDTETQVWSKRPDDNELKQSNLDRVRRMRVEIDKLLANIED